MFPPNVCICVDVVYVFVYAMFINFATILQRSSLNITYFYSFTLSVFHFLLFFHKCVFSLFLRIWLILFFHSEENINRLCVCVCARINMCDMRMRLVKLRFDVFIVLFSSSTNQQHAASAQCYRLFFSEVDSISLQYLYVFYI